MQMKHQGGFSGSRERSHSSVSPPVGFDPGRSDFTIADVLAWARTKPADEKYDFCDSSACAIAQFGRATGRSHLVGLLSDELARIDRGIFLAVLALGDDATFGRLARRLEALIPEPITKSDWLATDAYMATEQVSA